MNSRETIFKGSRMTPGAGEKGDFVRLNFSLPKPKRVFTKEQELCSLIYEESGKRLSFPLLMRFCKTHGTIAVREIWEEVKKSNPKDGVSLFMFLIGKNKIVYEE